jgi:hypothetical protein
LGADKGHNSNTNGNWVPVRIEVQDDGIVVFWNELELYQEALDLSTEHNMVGFSAGTGYYTMDVRLRKIEFSPL